VNTRLSSHLRRLAALLAVAICAATVSAATPAGAADLGGRPGWKLRWAPQARTDGLRAFEHVEDDRAGSDPAGSPHIVTQGDDYRFTMNSRVRDTSPDRQRNEVRGMMALGHAINMLKGQTWKITYQVYIPDTLKATTTFTHIMQMKMPGTGTNPMVTMSLRRHDGVQKLDLSADSLIGSVDLEPLQNHWIDIDYEMTIGDAPDGVIRWVVRDGAKTVIDTTKTGVDNYIGDRVRAKWGIYRSLGDTSGSLQDTYLLVRNLKAYQSTSHLLPPLNLRYEAENARVTQGTVDNRAGGYTGTGFVRLADTAGGSVEWTVLSLFSGPAMLNLWYANGSAAARPVDVTVNGQPVATGLSFDKTPAWNDWETRTLVTDLHPGINRIRVSAPAAGSAVAVDSLEVQQPALG
jgi:hypothetical protein